MHDYRKIRLFSALCCLVYFASYITRINYGAIIAEIVAAKDILKSEAGIVTTVSFFTYGLGQIVSGIISDRFDARRILTAGLFTSVAINFIMPFCPSIPLMALLWGINGFAQACIWPPMAKMMALNLDFTAFKRVAVNVAICGSLGTIAVYLTAPLLIRIARWESVFTVNAAAAALIGVLWVVFTRGAKTRSESSAEAKREKMPRRIWLTSGVLMIFASLICLGLLRDGVTTWLPSFVSENFNVATEGAILTAAILPLLSMISMKIGGYVHMRFVKNELLFSFVLCALTAISCAAAFLGQKNMLLCVGAMTAITAFSYVACSILTSMIPPYFSKYGHVSTMAGILNSMPYAGATISSWGFAKLSESSGWSVTILLWCAVALIAAMLCAITVGRWSRFKISTMKGENNGL